MKPPTQTKNPRIVISESDHARLLSVADATSAQASGVADYLAEELSRAHIVRDEDRSPNVVRMGSRVSYLEEKSGRTRTVTVVYPHEADIGAGRISVLTPIGAALIGLSPQQRMTFPAPDEAGILTVLKVENDESPVVTSP